MFDSRSTTLAPRERIDEQDWVAGVLATIVAILSALVFVLIYLPPR